MKFFEPSLEKKNHSLDAKRLVLESTVNDWNYHSMQCTQDTIKKSFIST